MTSVHNIPVTTISGSNTTLGEFAGSVMLVVNVASQCGLTPQYEALESLHQTYKDKGFSVLGFPANNFGAQEPGTDAEIAEFCSTKFDVKFPMFTKNFSKFHNTSGSWFGVMPKPLRRSRNASGSPSARGAAAVSAEYKGC